MLTFLFLVYLTGQVTDKPPCAVAEDEKYAYTAERPVQVGGGPGYGAARQRRYLEALRGPAGQAVHYERTGQARGADDTILDQYTVTYAGLEKRIVLYLDWYHYNPPFAPSGFTCARPFDLGLPPLDPFRESAQLLQVALDQGATRDFDPIPLTADGIVHGVVFDTFRLHALAARDASRRGQRVSPSALPADLRTIGTIIVGYPFECDKRTLRPSGIAMHGANGRLLPRDVKGNLASDVVARLLPGVAIPTGAVAVGYGMSRPRPGDVVVLAFTEDGCTVTGNAKSLRLDVTAARGLEMPPAILPPGAHPGPPMLFQVVVDTEGRIERPEYIGGAGELMAVARDSLRGWRVEPARVNGAPVASGVLLQVQFTERQ